MFNAGTVDLEHQARSVYPVASVMGKQLGFITHFQDEAKRIWYRNVRIKELDPPKP